MFTIKDDVESVYNNGNYVRSDTCSNGWFPEFDGKKKKMLNSTVFIVGPAGRRYNSGSTTVHCYNKSLWFFQEGTRLKKTFRKLFK